MSVNKVIVLLCNKSTILMKLEKNLGMRCFWTIYLHSDAKRELCMIKMYDIRKNIEDCTNQLIDQLIDSDSVKALMNVRKRQTCKISCGNAYLRKIRCVCVTT